MFAICTPNATKTYIYMHFIAFNIADYGLMMPGSMRACSSINITARSLTESPDWIRMAMERDNTSRRCRRGTEWMCCVKNIIILVRMRIARTIR